MPSLKRWWPAILLAALFLLAVALCPPPSRAETLELRRLCSPSHNVVAALRQAGFRVVAQWLSDDGWPIERWSDGGKGEALVVLAQADDGSVLRCLLFARSPRGEKS